MSVRKYATVEELQAVAVAVDAILAAVGAAKPAVKLDGLDYKPSELPALIEAGFTVQIDGEAVTREVADLMKEISYINWSSYDKSGKDKSGKDKSGKDKSGKDKSGKDKSGKDKKPSDLVEFPDWNSMVVRPRDGSLWLYVSPQVDVAQAAATVFAALSKYGWYTTVNTKGESTRKRSTKFYQHFAGGALSYWHAHIGLIDRVDQSELRSALLTVKPRLAKYVKPVEKPVKPVEKPVFATSFAV